MERDQLNNSDLMAVLEEFYNFFFTRIQKKGFGAFVSKDEILGRLFLEFSEVHQAIQNRESNEALIHELSDVATTALFAIASLEVQERLKVKNK